jgi:type II secretory pathway component PulF
VANFTRQVSDLLRSGLPLSRCLDVLVAQTTNEKFREVIRQLRSDVSGGMSFAEGLAQHRKVFNRLYTNMVHAGEISGSLGDVMRRLAEFYESELETRGKIISAMAYPAIMIFVGIGVVLVLLTFVIPRFTVMFEDMGQNLPMITEFLVSLSDFLVNYWWVMILALVGLVFAYTKYVATPEGRLHVDTLKLKAPLLGDFLRKREIAKFARTLGTLLANGVPILTALEIVEAVMSNRVLEERIEGIRDNIREGERVSEHLGQGGVFPPMVVNMIAVGEETGSLEETLDRIALTYEGETDRAMRTLTTLIEPLLILVMGAVVGFIVIAMILPIFMLSTGMR